MTTTATANTAERRIELYLRGDTYGTYDRQADTLDRVAALDERGVVDETAVDASWQRVRTPELDSRDGALATYEEFREWAGENDYSLAPAFERRQRSYVGTDVVHDVVSFPVISLAVYDGPALRAVFPCADGDGDLHFTVGDCLDAFEDGEASWLDRFSSVGVDRAEPRLDAVAQ
jgi:hypothetical protein